MPYELLVDYTKNGRIHLDWEDSQAKAEAMTARRKRLGLRFPEALYDSLRGTVLVDPAEFPLKARVYGRTRLPLPNFFNGGNGRPVVSESWRAAIEALEPGLHQFIPVDIRDKQGEPIGQSLAYLKS